MTPRTIESLFAEALEKQTSTDAVNDLTLDGPITKQILPRVLLAELQLQNDPDFKGEPILLNGYFYSAYDSVAQAKKIHSNVETVVAKPWSFGKFLQDPGEIIFDFGTWGAAFVTSKNLGDQEKSFRRYVLGIWLSYALSPELWGAQGKWTRFHERLMSLFHAANLLDGESSAGYYRLSARAALLSEKGFLGTNLDKSYLLVLPWSFSLTALEKLETIVRQEF